MPCTIPTDEQLADECRKIVSDNIRYAWPRCISSDRFKWGDWVDAAERALDCGDFSEYRSMCEEPEPEPCDLVSAWERRQEHLAHLADLRRDDAMISEWEAGL